MTTNRKKYRDIIVTAPGYYVRWGEEDWSIRNKDAHQGNQLYDEFRKQCPRARQWENLEFNTDENGGRAVYRVYTQRKK